MKRLLAVLLLIVNPLQAEGYPWSNAAPAEIAAASLHPDQVLDEEPCNWRPVLSPIISRMVQHCTSAREATLHIAANLGRTTGVYYTPQRRKHNMNALEALAEKKVSCTGQSILLICALRSVDIPARAVGVLCWNHIRGNHTWAEAWFDGAWHMIEFNEQSFNTPWVMENIGMLDSRIPWQRIKAATPTGKSRWYLPEQPRVPAIPAEDVTTRYMELARQHYAKSGMSADYQPLLVDLQPRSSTPPMVELLNDKQEVVSSLRLPALSDDMRYFTRMQLPRTGQYYLRIEGRRNLIPISATAEPVQIVRLR